MNQQKVKYVLYARKSSEDDDKQIQSIEDQLTVLKKLAKEKDLKVVATLQEAKSAKAPFQRPEFNKMLKMIEKGEAQAILCWHINRLTRNPAEGGMIQQLLHDNKLQFIQTHDRLHLASDNDLIFAVEASMSSQFIRDLRSSVKRGIAAKLRSGAISGLAMAGYINKQNGDEKWIEPDPIRYHLIRKAWDMMLTGEYSVPEVLKALTEWGYTTPKRKKIGGGPLTRSALYNIFNNPRYCGWIPDPYAPGEYIKKVSYQPMVTVEEFDRVQSLLGDKGRPRLSQSKRFALRGLIRCAECGCQVTAEEHKKKQASGEVKIHRYYHCTRKRPCTQKASIREEELFKQVEDLLDRYELSPQLYQWGLEALDELAQKEIMERNHIQVAQFDTINDIEEQLDRLLDMAVKGLIDQKEYDNKSKDLKISLKNYQKAQSETAERTKNWYEFVGKQLETLTNASEKFANGDLSDKAEILLAIGQNPLLMDRTLQITPNKWMIPVGDRVKAIREELAEVRTNPDRLDEKALLDKESSLKNSWYAWQDSNLRPSVPQTDALSS